MNDQDFWHGLAQEMAEAVRNELGGEGSASSALVRGIKTKGAAPKRRKRSIIPSKVVVVEVAEGDRAPSQDQLEAWLTKEGVHRDDMDTYYLIHDRHGAALGPRKLNPDDTDTGHDSRLLLRNLKPDFVLIPEGSARPDWCGGKTQVIEYPPA